MGVYIKGMEMPKQCYDCYLVAMDMDSGKLYCKHLNEDIEDWSGILSSCPLVEVKTPHGKLIDADVCKQRVYDGSRTPYKTCPTVIEAEVE